nr:zinc finger, CCHC-type [Tanacetum cinerariifolium]
MQMEIMKRVPVESLFRFISISKEWKFVIDSSHFAKAYNMCQTQPHHSFVRFRTCANKCACAIITNDDAFPKQKFFHLPKYVETSITESVMVGCDHGLVCFSREWKKMYVLWNPSLRKLVSIDLPTSSIWGWRYGVYTQRSLNTLTQIVVERILVADELQVIRQRKYPQRVISSEVVSILNIQRALGSNTLLWKVITRFQVISGNHLFDFRRWQKKMHCMLSSMSVVYVLTTPIPEDGGENPTVEQVRKRAKWDNDDYVCRGLIINAKYMAEDASSKKFLVSNFTNYKMTDSRPVLEQYNKLLQILGSHLRIKKSLRVQDSDKPKGNNVAGPSVVNMVEHNNSSRYNDNKGKHKHHDTRANPNKKPKVTCWKYGKPGHLKKDCKAGNVGNRANRSSTKGSEMMMLHGGLNLEQLCMCAKIDDAFMSTSKLNDSILWHARLGHVHFKRMQDMSNDGLIRAIDMDTKKCKTCMLNKITKKSFQNVKRETKVLELIHIDLCDLHTTPSLGNKKYFVTFIDDASRLPDPKLKTLSERGIECIFVGYAEHSKAFRFYVIEPTDSVAINSIIESRDPIFDGHRFSFVPRPSQRSLVRGTKDSSGSVVSERVTDEIVQELRKSKRRRTPKDFRPEFQLYLIEGTRDEKEAINDEMDSIIGNNTWVLTDLPPGCRPLGCKWIFKRKLQVDGTVEKFKARLVIQDFKQKSGIDYFDIYALVARISSIRLLIAMASIHNLIIHQMDVKTTFLNRELKEEVYMNQPLGFILPGNENKVSKLIKSMYGLKQVDLAKEFLSLRFFMKDMGEADVILGIKIKHESNVSTPLDTCEKLLSNIGLDVSQLEYSRMIGCLMYAMTCTRPDIAFAVGKLSSNTEDNSSTSGWVFLLGAVGKKAEWLKNLLLEIPLWVKPMAPISIRCDSAATLAKAYSQIYNGKSRHLGVRHSMIQELIMNEEISIEFVRSQQNQVDHLMKGLARDLVIKTRAEAHVLQIIPRMCLEPVDKEDEVVNFSMVNFFEKVLSRGMNKEEPPMIVGNLVQLYDLFIPVSGDGGTEYTPRESNPSEEVSSAGYLIKGCFSIEPSAGMLLSGLANASGH